MPHNSGLFFVFCSEEESLYLILQLHALKVVVLISATQLWLDKFFPLWQSHPDEE